MPSKSKSQQRLMGAAWAYRKGEAEKVPEPAKEIANSKISDKDLKAFAKTKHKGLPERLKEALNENLNESFVPKYANGYKPKFDKDSNRLTILIMPEYVDASGGIVSIFESKGFTMEKIRTKTLLGSEASEVLKSKKDRKWYKLVRDKLISAPSMCIEFKYEGDSLDKSYESAREKIRRVLKLKNIHSCFLKDITAWPFFGEI